MVGKYSISNKYSISKLIYTIQNLENEGIFKFNWTKMPLMKKEKLTLLLLTFIYLISCSKDNVHETKNNNIPVSLGYAKAIVDNGDTIYFKHIKKSRYFKNDGPRGNLYIAYENVNDTGATDRQIKFAISKSFNLDFIDFTKPLSPNSADLLTIMNKSFIDATNAIDLTFEIERGKDSLELETSAKNQTLNINYAYLKVSMNSFQ